MYDGIVHRGQFGALGLTRADLRARLGRGAWRQVLPDVYATFDGYLSVRQRWTAACLYAGTGAVLTGRAALRLHAVAAAPVDPYVRVLIPHRRRVPSSGFVRVHRTRRADPYTVVGGPVRVCSLARAVVDAARWCRDLTEVRALVAEVVDGGPATVGELRRELDAGPAAGSGLLRLVLDERGGS